MTEHDLVTMEIDREACIGGGQCEMLAPDVFELGDDAISTVIGTGTLSRDQAAEIADRCPGRAVSHH